MKLDWYGDRVAQRVEARAAGAMAETVDAAVGEAKANTPVDTGAARDSVYHEGAGGLLITWGYHVAHGFFVEVGARGKAGVHALRRAADHQYPQLAGRIARRGTP